MTDSERSRARADAPRAAREALREASRHARLAAAEALAAARALLDAATLAASGELATERPGLSALAQGLEDLGRQLGGDDSPMSEPLARAILDALDAEIARWESRSGEDADARAVLRAFFGLREILWEFGIRRENGGAPDAGPAQPGPPRVQRVEVTS